MIQMNQVAPGSGDSCGARLRKAREAAGFTQDEVSARLKMPSRIVNALESGDWDALGAPVFVRGQLRSYARLLKLELDVDACLDEAHVGPVVPAELVSHSHTPRYRHLFEQATRRAVYIVLTAAIAVPVWLATRPHLSKPISVQSLDIPGQLADSDDNGKVRDGNAAESPRTTSRRKPERTPVIASITPRGAQEASAPELSLVFNSESWMEVRAPDGSTVEQGLLAAGERRTYEADAVHRIVLGNATAVEVRQDGRTVDLEPFSRANVARFTLSSDGSVAPAAD
jgi:cytoskeleton protein RodZ